MRFLFVCLVVVIGWAYWPTLRELAAVWDREADYSHGFLVIPLSLLFLWTRRLLYPNQCRPALATGLTLAVAGLIVRYVGLRYALFPLDGYSLILSLFGIVLMCSGWQAVRWAAPSILFLWFMIPLPFQTERLLSIPLQRIATVISSFLLQCLGQPAFAEGHTIWLGSHQLFVEQACSGLRMFVGTFALACAYLIMAKRPAWEQAILLVSVFPIAVLANSARIVGTGLLYQAYGSEPRIQQMSHDFAGVLMIPLAASLFAAVSLYLSRLMPVIERVGMNEMVVRGREAM